MTLFSTSPKARGFTPLSLFGVKAAWLKVAGVYPTQGDVDVATYLADLTGKKAGTDAVEYRAWVLMARAAGSDHTQTRVGTGTGQTQVNALKARALIYPEVFTLESARKGHFHIVMKVTLPLPYAAAPRKARKARKVSVKAVDATA